LKTVGPTTENARQTNSVRTRGGNSRRAPDTGRAHRSGRRCDGQHVMEIWLRGRRQHLVGKHRGLVRDAVFIHYSVWQQRFIFYAIIAVDKDEYIITSEFDV